MYMIRVLPNRNEREFQTFYIRAHSSRDSEQWDWGITNGITCIKQDKTIYSENSVFAFNKVCKSFRLERIGGIHILPPNRFRPRYQ